MKDKIPQRTKEKLNKHYHDCVPSITIIYKWFLNFRRGHKGITDT